MRHISSVLSVSVTVGMFGGHFVGRGAGGGVGPPSVGRRGRAGLVRNVGMGFVTSVT